MTKREVFAKEVNLISTSIIKEWVLASLDNVPDYFFRGMASSTGKYHPQCTCKKHGLLIHVKRTIYLANRLCTGWGFDTLTKDIVLAAVILHDIAKVPSPKEDPKITYADYENHPINAEKYFALNTELNTEPNQTTIKLITEAIRHHMGLWTPTSIKKSIINYSLVELAVYTADYMSATKDLVTPVDNEEINIDGL
jgi:23S rRNA maturation-related 3'-5' exoribonuclease YhaM